MCREGEWPEDGQRYLLPVGCVIGGDGSGGEHGSDPRLRRVGWAFAICLGESVLASCRGSTAGWRQTVPRAELLAV
eukprot:3729368-Pyramimonas_sp.AAC.1